jgi:CheY-like chemotaxis protein
MSVLAGASPWPKRRTTVIVLTSGARSDDLKRCEELGVAAHLMKPVKQSELFDAIGMSLGITISEDEGETTLRRDRKLNFLRCVSCSRKIAWSTKSLLSYGYVTRHKSLNDQSLQIKRIEECRVI